MTPVASSTSEVRGTPEQAAESIRSIVHNADSALPITYFRTVNEQVNRSLNTERIPGRPLRRFWRAGVAAVLVGLYGVGMTFLSSRSAPAKSEYGSRWALGAARRCGSFSATLS